MPFDYSDIGVLFFNDNIDINKKYNCEIVNVSIEDGKHGEYIKLTIKTPFVKKIDEKTIPLHCTRIFSLNVDRVPKALKPLFKFYNIMERPDIKKLVGVYLICSFHPSFNKQTETYRKDTETQQIYTNFTIEDFSKVNIPQTMEKADIQQTVLGKTTIETEIIEQKELLESEEEILCNICKRPVKKSKFKDHIINNCQTF